MTCKHLLIFFFCFLFSYALSDVLTGTYANETSTTGSTISDVGSTADSSDPSTIITNAPTDNANTTAFYSMGVRNKTIPSTTPIVEPFESAEENENVTMWSDGSCANSSESDMIKLNATGRSLQIGQWTLVRWGFYGTDWMCDIRGNRMMHPVFSPEVDTIRLTVNPNGTMGVGHMRCNAFEGPRCNPAPLGPNCELVDSLDYCFRLRIHCDYKDMEEEYERLRGQKWISFGYGTLCGFVIGCIITAIGMMCLDDHCQVSESSERKKRSRR